LRKSNQIAAFLFSLLILGLYCPYLHSQIPFVDTLKKITESKIPDTSKIDRINELILQNSSNYPEYTIEFSNLAIALADTLNDSVRLSRSINRKGIAYYYLGDYNNAIDQYFRSLQISEKLNLFEYIASDYNNIGLVLIEENLYQESLEYFFKAKSILEGINRDDLMARVYDNIGISYYSLNQYDTALVWYQKSYAINSKINQRRTIASNFKNIGNVFMQKANYAVALIHYKEALKIYEDLNIKQEQANLLDQIGLANAFIKKFDEANNCFITAQQLISEIKSTSLHLQNIKSVAKYYELRGNFKSSQIYTNKYIHLSDSLKDSDKRKKYEQLRALVETQDKIKELQILKTLNAAQKETIKNQKIIQYGIFVVLIFSLVIIALIYNTLRIKNKINKKLEGLVNERTLELKIAKERAEESDLNKSTFLKNISHEVRTPMNAIVGFSDLLLSRNVELNERTEYIINIQKGTLNLLKIFDKITYLSQLEGSDIIPVQNELYIEELFKALHLKYSLRITECNIPISLSYSIPESLKFSSIKTYSSILEKTLDELIENAVKFTSKGEVCFGLTIVDHGYHFFVKDTGIGIDPAHKGKVFDNFTKFADSNCSLSEGAGIGLTIVKKNLELIGGSIYINSSKENGTHIEFTIPV